MNIKSSVFENNEYIPRKYTCDGENINPPLTLAEIPDNTKSLVLIVNDPDAPSGDFIHWVVYNIAPDELEVNENSVPAGGVGGMNDSGNSGYAGPCPPPASPHRYFFRVFALDSVINLDKGARISEIKEKMDGRVIASAELLGLYKRD
ncbi:hypothetical protein A3D05_03370 [Candidatus Gottesmanbacteria bacterium RIFCSPHIGHO2_02_FULL_40_24]|uniref:Phosphatidylethanolamine-binding protein n=1 Tax=Candidatus Gottesmanbacteria bacterium RIFCSPHIGHO2_01_FULL_40_15 TaxID=1798376 RepID=A0A1F5Z0R1_9BACT|nr:MAG: hypothetical protein A2777_02495 [Candidatus Gottesmanbacteria bacterium RIFCSPHIGHO2_01_FULL_40_15]OGG17873.1 MAG: hypothetical protein A3D05_03370 [Candidatus Gottesmanbacteria bacterium RIFCSPHIGHO2_02_FULL_40_24]OGG21741.1 MAG: hypothetical protein A3B48_03520 [Candidatus Gottesmanbacteria bacterium RIFCSPLOWO2_01_FULL_40_10]OGG24714.1 MAG: hypothetical protein A3E42_01550 [Candidatus Gottesmanbacteria bacterium RIFCSPHIGHO2_12_FULL_40_13]OGG31993.1 MAG: hypothetical protein A3I80_0